MAEQRLIDANKLIEKCENLYMRGHVLFHGVTAFTIENAHTIDPETIPIVRQLRAELARVTAERDAAEKDRAELADYELAVCEQFCFGDRERNIAPCAWLIDGMCELRTWRGPQKEG